MIHTNLPPSIDDVHAAAQRLTGKVVVTPLLRNDVLGAITGTNAFVKAECLQHTGSFKFRGAYNSLSVLPGEKRKLGVVACSSGNHGQGIAEAARMFGTKATIFMPSDAPVLKAERVARSDADIIRFDRATDDRDEMARDFSKRTGATLIHPYEYREVIAGQGTCGLEIADQLDSLDTVPDRILVCCGGGGLSAGISLAIHERFPDTKICTVEPEGFDDYRRSLKAGKILANKTTTGSLCDALMSPQPGEMSFAINKIHISESLVASDSQVMRAMRFAFEELKLVLEPSGAIALAALLAQQTAWRGETVICVLSGGNIDPSLYSRILGNEG